jgi:hypothetical protein
MRAEVHSANDQVPGRSTVPAGVKVTVGSANTASPSRRGQHETAELRSAGNTADEPLLFNGPDGAGTARERHRRCLFRTSHQSTMPYAVFPAGFNSHTIWRLTNSRGIRYRTVAVPAGKHAHRPPARRVTMRPDNHRRHRYPPRGAVGSHRTASLGRRHNATWRSAASVRTTSTIAPRIITYRSRLCGAKKY